MVKFNHGLPKEGASKPNRLFSGLSRMIMGGDSSNAPSLPGYAWKYPIERSAGDDPAKAAFIGQLLARSK